MYVPKRCIGTTTFLRQRSSSSTKLRVRGKDLPSEMLTALARVVTGYEQLLIIYHRLKCVMHEVCSSGEVHA